MVVKPKFKRFQIARSMKRDEGTGVFAWPFTVSFPSGATFRARDFEARILGKLVLAAIADYLLPGLSCCYE
ncbi:hypothetical protein L0156_20325 [bacterium]|nr:hypothetical protein [bacterium]